MQCLRVLVRNSRHNIFNVESKVIYSCGQLAKRSYCINEDQRTTVDILNRHSDGPLMINTYSREGFRLNNGLFVVGPMVIFPSTVLSWNVADDFDIDESALSLFEYMDPRVDILIIGLSKQSAKIRSQVQEIYKILRKMKINFEVMDCDRACPTFNFLSNEGRFVAAALMPPVKIRLSEDDFSEQFNRRKKQASDDYLIGDPEADEKEKQMVNKAGSRFDPKSFLDKD